MPPDIHIRPLANTCEAERCAHMMASSEPWITLRRDYQASLQTITAAEKEVYLAVAGREIAGFVILNMHGAFIGYIQSICVAPRWRHSGIGSQLMAFVEERIFRETPNAFICVSSFNPDARRLYEKWGYQIVGELKDYVIAGHSEFLLRKTIAPLTEFTLDSHTEVSR